MPCWYYDKKELRSTPSFADNIDPGTEARYRREGARFILDAGAKLGLRHDTCTTGVVYFHRFYMFHSFKEFHRYVTGACCLFLAGKVEETPKKCKDIIKTCQSLLTSEQYKVFGEDPKEEVMTLERVLLQTIKFDLQVDHPYGILLKYAKLIKGDKEKIQKMVQMAWTFVNDSLCTTLCLQWEPEIVAVSLMYLASRLTKYDVQDYQGKIPGSKLKWWEYIVEDMSMELMEDVCHQVLDLYSPSTQKREESPPLTPARKTITSQVIQQSPGPTAGAKRSHSTTPSDGSAQKIPKIDPSLARSSDGNRQLIKTEDSQATVTTSQTEPQNINTVTASTESNNHSYSQYNPYMSSKMYSSSFLSQEGSRNIQSLLSNPGPQAQPPPQTSQYSYNQPPPHSQPAPYSYPPPPQAYTPAVTYQSQAPGYQPPYSAAPSAHSYPGPQHPPSYPPNYEPPPVQSYQPPPVNHPPPQHPGGPPPQGYPPHYGERFDRPPYNPPGPMRGNPPGIPRGPRPYHHQAPPPQQTKGLPTVRITGR